jgi:membrane protein DedA with SNARE-associated domain
MPDLNLTNTLLPLLSQYGSVAFGLALFLGALGLPIPTTLLVVAAGAFSRSGLIDGNAALGSGLLGAALGDNAGYALGHLGGGWVQRRFGRSATWRKAQASFARRGALAVYLTRFLITPLAIPTNLIAGSSRYQFRQFLTYDIAGEFTWLLLFGGLGYVFGDQWPLVSQVVSDYGVWVGSSLVGGSAVYYLLRHLGQAARPTISPQTLFQK